jgi:hypothetical protein
MVVSASLSEFSEITLPPRPMQRAIFSLEITAAAGAAASAKRIATG